MLRLIRTLTFSTGSALPRRWITRVPVNSDAVSSVIAKPRRVSSPHPGSAPPARPGPPRRGPRHGHLILAHMLVVARDVGTSSARARAFDAEGRALRGVDGH